MLEGKELGKAIAEAIKLKLEKGYASSRVEIAKHFGIAPPSLYDWERKGTIKKGRLNELWSYFSDVVDMEHWGMPGIDAEQADTATASGYGEVTSDHQYDMVADNKDLLMTYNDHPHLRNFLTRMENNHTPPDAVLKAINALLQIDLEKDAKNKLKTEYEKIEQERKNIKSELKKIEDKKKEVDEYIKKMRSLDVSTKRANDVYRFTKAIRIAMKKIPDRKLNPIIKHEIEHEILEALRKKTKTIYLSGLSTLERDEIIKDDDNLSL